MALIEKSKFNFLNMFKNKSKNVITKGNEEMSNDNDDKIDSKKLVPKLSDMEFKWIDDHY